MVTRDSNPKGFIEIVAKVPNKELVNVKKDEDVFLADVSADNHLISNPKNKTMPGLFWDLEENQMVTQ
ncbi:hypothetical protein [Aneurinibacillus danicus]|uniref:Uncharacterized protein n=1 Tax=Aneurinibacillus danicus TaxID=267746 RepID=A0A511VBT3_9BACL|nr:hypothetical protein [Aneurinibacillus danicus]GEN36377.1 hypothetical protein ADA01nite_38370 [Aneurinibacillus danicus]